MKRKYKNDYSMLWNLTNSNSLYWLGFLAGDANISDRGEIKLHLALRDILQLEKFKTFVKSENIISTYKSFQNGKEKRSCQFSICGKEVTSRLIDLGITPRKSLTLEIKSEEMLNSKVFWRGMIDSDGSVGITNHHNKNVPKLSFCGSYQVVLQFIVYINTYICKTLTKPRKYNKIFQVAFDCQKAYKIIRHLYCKTRLSLDRKQLIARVIFKLFSEYNK